MIIAIGMVLLTVGLGVHAFVLGMDAGAVLPQSPSDGLSCQAELDALYAYAAEGMGFEPSPITTIHQVFGIAPGMYLVPSGVILNFEDSSTWFGRQQPFDSLLKWGHGGFRHESDGTTKLTGLIYPIDGNQYQLMEGTMTPLNTPWDGALETGALVIQPADPNNPKEWVYVYSSYAPADWNCEQGTIWA
jgi:hypothetical protein